MHTSLRHYAITVERDAASRRRTHAHRAESRRVRSSRFSLRIPSIAQVARRTPAFGG